MNNIHRSEYALPFPVKDKEGLTLRFTFNAIAKLDRHLLKSTGKSTLQTLEAKQLSHEFVLSAVAVGVQESYTMRGLKGLVTAQMVGEWLDEHPQGFGPLAEAVVKAISVSQGIDPETGDPLDTDTGDPTQEGQEEEPQE